jgi:hypothetical protein
VATFADDEEESLLSGKALVRKYFDVAFGAEDSLRFLPDAHIEAWNPENRDMDPKAVGKNLHLEALCKRLGVKKKQVVLFDDSNKNCELARKKGYSAIDIKEPVRADDSDDVTGGFGEDAWKNFLVAEAQRANSGGGCVLM